MARVDIKFYSRLGAMASALEGRVSQVIHATLYTAAEIAAASMEGQSAPSAPGGPPAIRTGLLHGSLQVKMLGALRGIVFTNTEYAPHLEFGTVFMEARPFLRPAFNKIEAALFTAIRRVMSHP